MRHGHVTIGVTLCNHLWCMKIMKIMTHHELPWAIRGCHDGPSPGAIPDHGPQTEGPGGPAASLKVLRDSMGFGVMPRKKISLDFNDNYMTAI